MTKFDNSGVYAIVNKVNGHKYIGSAMNIYRRWNTHKRRLNKNNHHSIYLQNAWNKYGADSFEITVIEYCRKESLVEREQFYIDNELPEYNICPTAGSCFGRAHSEESKEKVRLALLGHPVSKQSKEKMRAVGLGRICPEEVKEKIRLANLGKHIVSEETREKIRLAQIGKSHGQWSKEARKNHSLAMLGHPVSVETRKKISESLKLRSAKSSEVKAK